MQPLVVNAAGDQYRGLADGAVGPDLTTTGGRSPLRRQPTPDRPFGPGTASSHFGITGASQTPESRWDHLGRHGR